MKTRGSEKLLPEAGGLDGVTISLARTVGSPETELVIEVDGSIADLLNAIDHIGVAMEKLQREASAMLPEYLREKS